MLIIAFHLIYDDTKLILNYTELTKAALTKETL